MEDLISILIWLAHVAIAICFLLKYRFSYGRYPLFSN